LYSSLADAVLKGATTLYFEPVDRQISIRKRIKSRLTDCGTHPVEYMDPIIGKIKSMVDMGSRTSGSIKTRIANREVFVTAKIIDDGNNRGAILRFRYPGKKTSLERFSLGAEHLAAINKALWAGRGLILITGRDSALRESLGHSILMECAPGQRKVMALFREEDVLSGIECYAVGTSGDLNAIIANLMDSGLDAVYIEDIRRDGIRLDALLQLAENTTVIASLSTPSGRDGIAFIERHTPELSAENRGLNLVIETEKDPTPCQSCSLSVHSSVGKGCRKCGYSGLTGYTEKINIVNYA
jgi:hypothetical protein